MSSLLTLWRAAADGEAEGGASRQAPAPVAGIQEETLSPVDAALVERLRVGDERAFRECYQAYAESLWRYAMRLLGSRDAAHDVVQDIFFSLFTKREALAIRGSVRTYLFGAVRHATLNLLRHDTVAQRVADTSRRGETPAMGAQELRLDEKLERHDIEARVMRALATLPERQRSAMILRWEHGLTTAQIARTLGVADTVAGRLLLKAAIHLRRQLAEFEK